MPKKTDSLQGTLDLLILTTLERGPNHGFGITVHIQSVSEGFLQVEEGSLYPALRRLERDKFIKGEWKITDNGRRARYYRLTPSGKNRLLQISDNWAALTRSVAKLLRFV